MAVASVSQFEHVTVHSMKRLTMAWATFTTDSTGSSANAATVDAVDGMIEAIVYRPTSVSTANTVRVWPNNLSASPTTVPISMVMPTGVQCARVAVQTTYSATTFVDGWPSAGTVYVELSGVTAAQSGFIDILYR